MIFVGHTRFSLFQPGAGAWQASNRTRFRTPEEYREHLYAPERLDARADIFFSMTLPQLDRAARGWPVQHIVSYSESLPSPYQNLLLEAAGKYPWLVLDRCAPGQPAADPLGVRDEGVIGVYRLDDDDILPADYFDQVAPYMSDEHAGMFVSLGVGLTALYRDGGLYFARRMHQPMLASGLLAIHTKRPDGSTVSPPVVAHNKSDRAAPVILDSRSLGYVWVRHPDQDTSVHAVETSRDERMERLLQAMAKEPPAHDRHEIAAHFPAVVDRIHTAPRPGESVQVPVAARTLIPPAGLSLPITAARGRVQVMARLQCDALAAPRSALLAIDLATPDGRPVGPEWADRLIDSGLTYSKAVGYYHYLKTRPGKGTSQFTLDLPDEVCVVSAAVQKWKNPDSAIHILQLVLTSAGGEQA